MDSTDENWGAAEVFGIVRELLEMKGTRFDWEDEIKRRMIDDWKAYFVRYHEVSQRADALLKQLHERGSERLANKLAAYLVEHEAVANPNVFDIRSYTGRGFETLTIHGSQELDKFLSERAAPNDIPWHIKGLQERTDRPQDLNAGAPTQVVYDEPEQHSSYLLSHAQPVPDLEVDMSQWPVWSLRKVVQQRLWISTTELGAAFCVECDCPALLRPTMALGKAPQEQDYHRVARHFHTDPFKDDAALIHFLRFHRTSFQNIQDMLQQKGRRVVDEGEMPMDLWAIAAHNFSVKAENAQYLSMWDRWQEEYREKAPLRIHRLRAHRLSQVNRTVNARMVQGNKVFPWPSQDSEHWVVVCNYPDCVSPSFSYHPLRKQRALKHFQSHGLHLQDELEVLELYGYKVHGHQDTQSAKTKDVTHDEPAPVKKETTNSVRGKSGYHKYNTEALFNECQRRGIVISTSLALTKRKTLVKKLNEDDGVEDYRGKWTSAQLREESKKRGLCTTRGKNGLIAQLIHDDKKRGEEQMHSGQYRRNGQNGQQGRN